MSTQELLTLSAFAARCGVSQPAISKAIRGPLLPIKFDRFVDAAHPLAVAYMEKRKGLPMPVVGKKGDKTTRKRNAIPPESRKTTEGSGVPIPEDIQSVADLTLRELIQKHGNNVKFFAWLKGLKTIEDINKTQIDNARSEGLLVSRELVKVGVIDPINSAHVKMMTDGAKTITRRATAMHDGGTSLENIELFVRDQIASFIKPVKAKVRRALKNG